MKDLLTNYYAIQVKEEIIIDGKTGFKSDEYVYFTITPGNKKALHMEQAALAYYLVEMGYNYIAFPIPNFYGDWITKYGENKFIVLQVKQPQTIPPQAHGILLASFHRSNTTYKYEPQNISSYGQWKPLWIDKLTAFENQIIEEAKKYPTPYYRLLMDVLPYLIGISENAIQYMQESEQEKRYDESDQGTIAFQRYEDQLLRPIIWSNELVYDHSTRDIAEHIRSKLLLGEQGLEDIWLFIKDYESVQPLSVFSWRLLYARLIFPIHIFDLVGSGFSTRDFEQQYEKLNSLLEKQVRYEQSLRRLFEVVELNDETLRIPMLQWL